MSQKVTGLILKLNKVTFKKDARSVGITFLSVSFKKRSEKMEEKTYTFDSWYLNDGIPSKIKIIASSEDEAIKKFKEQNPEMGV